MFVSQTCLHQLDLHTSLMLSCFSFGFCPHLTEDNRDQLMGKDLLVAYYDVDYERNPKGSNYWRNRLVLLQALRGRSGLICW